MVKRGEEDMIQYHVSSPLSNDLHPVRPKPDDLAKLKQEEVPVEAPKAHEEIKVAKPKLKKMITTELKEEKGEDIDAATAPAEKPEE
jgi:hypothetical protein